MKIKGTTRTIMFKIFCLISFLGCCLLLCVSDVDIDNGGLRTYFLLFFGWVLSVFITSILYDSQMYLRHLYATRYSIQLVYGYLKHKKGVTYHCLYNIADDSDSFKEFYNNMLFIYDDTHNRKEN